MGYHEQLIVEINSQLDALGDRPWEASWVAHAICNSHLAGLSENDDALFWRHCGYAECRDQVRKCINRRAGIDEERQPGQRTLPGFDYLQSHYLVKRDGIEVGVPVYDLSGQELEAKAAQYRSMGAACFAHANEIDRFRADRMDTAPLLAVMESEPA